MAFCWIGDVALTFSGETAFLIGLVSFLAGHVMFLMAFRHLLSQGASRSSKSDYQAVTMVLLFGVLTPTMASASGEWRVTLRRLSRSMPLFIATRWPTASWRAGGMGPA